MFRHDMVIEAETEINVEGLGSCRATRIVINNSYYRWRIRYGSDSVMGIVSTDNDKALRSAFERLMAKFKNKRKLK